MPQYSIRAVLRHFAFYEVLEAVFISIAHRLNGLFARILRCFPLQSVRIAAEKRLACKQTFTSFGAPCFMKTTS